MGYGKESFRHKVKQFQEREMPCVLPVPELEVWTQLTLPPALYVGHECGIIPSVLQSFFGFPLFYYPLVFAFEMEVFNLGRCML